MRIELPAFLEVQPDEFKAVRECSYAEVLLARKHEKDARRQGQIDRLLKINGAAWIAFPLMTVEDMLQK